MKHLFCAAGVLLFVLLLPLFVVQAGGNDGYVCPPCNCSKDGEVFDKAGSCPACGMALMKRGEALNVAIVIHDGVELLDWAGPGEVFAAAGPFVVYTVGATTKPIVSQGFATVTPQYGVAEAPKPDIIVIPGGGPNNLLASKPLMGWIGESADDAKVLMSVCTGAFALAQLGLLDGLEVTTHYGAIDGLKQQAPKARVHENTRYIDNGKIVTTAGVSAGIDGALHVVSRLLGQETARATARYMEYDKWQPGEGLDVSGDGKPEGAED